MQNFYVISYCYNIVFLQNRFLMSISDTDKFQSKVMVGLKPEMSIKSFIPSKVFERFY